jgi:hypothetical protein
MTFLIWVGDHPVLVVILLLVLFSGIKNIVAVAVSNKKG